MLFYVFTICNENKKHVACAEGYLNYVEILAVMWNKS